MTIFIPRSVDGYELCQPTSDEDLNRIVELVNGTPRKAPRSPIEVEVIHRDEGVDLVTSDSPWYGSNALIFRPSVVEQLGDLLVRNGELLPLRCDECQLFMYNVTRVIDGLDASSSVIHRFDDGRVMRIEKYAFRNSLVSGFDCFKIPDFRASPTFVSQRFADAWRNSRLTGLKFKPVGND